MLIILRVSSLATFSARSSCSLSSSLARSKEALRTCASLALALSFATVAAAAPDGERDVGLASRTDPEYGTSSPRVEVGSCGLPVFFPCTASDGECN